MHAVAIKTTENAQKKYRHLWRMLTAIKNNDKLPYQMEEEQQNLLLGNTVTEVE